MSAAAQKIETNDDLSAQLNELIGEFSDDDANQTQTQTQADQPTNEQTPTDDPAAEKIAQVELADADIDKLTNVMIMAVESGSREVIESDVANWPASSIGDLVNYAITYESLAVEQVDGESAEQYRDAATKAQAKARANFQQASDSQKSSKPKKGKTKAKGGSKAKTSSTKSSGAQQNAGEKAEKQPEEPVVAETFARAPAQITLKEERTKKVPLPETFYLEADPNLAEKHRGHQVDPSRPEACTPVMPNLDLFKSTGNPYPSAPDDTVVTTDKYKPFVTISYLTFKHLSENGAMYGRKDKELVESIVSAAGVPLSADARTCVQDTLRDCALYGLCTQYLVNKRTRLFKIEA